MESHYPVFSGMDRYEDFLGQPKYNIFFIAIERFFLHTEIKMYFAYM